MIMKYTKLVNIYTQHILYMIIIILLTFREYTRFVSLDLICMKVIMLINLLILYFT